MGAGGHLTRYLDGAPAPDRRLAGHPARGHRVTGARRFMAREKPLKGAAFRWRRWESNPRPQPHMNGVYECVRRSDLTLRSPTPAGLRRASPSEDVPGSAEAFLPG